MPEDLKGLALTESLRQILAERLSGKLRVSAGPLEKCLFFRNGALVFATSNHPQERLGELLYKEGKITAHDREMAGTFPMPGKKFGDTLVEMGKLTEAELDEMLRKQVAEIAKSVFLMQEGHLHFSEDAHPAQEVQLSGLSTHNVILEGIREMPFTEEMRSMLGSTIRPLKLTADAYRIAELVTLKTHEGFIVSRVDGIATLSEIAPLVPGEEYDTYRLLYGLRVLGLLVENPARETAADAIRGGQGSGSDRGAQPGYALPNRKTGEGDGPRDVVALYANLQQLDYYQLLGVPNNSSTASIKKTYYRMAKIYHPDRFQSSKDKELQKKASLVFGKMTEAYEVLVDAEARMAYDHRRPGTERDFRKVDRREEKMAEKDARESTDKASAEESYKRGMDLLSSRKYAEAIEPLTQATRLSPRNLEYLFALGRAQTKHPPTRKEAEKTFLRAVNVDKLNAEPYLQMGKYYKEIKEFQKAEQLFTRALTLDDENEEARKEMASMPGREEQKKSFWSRLTGR